MSTPDFDVIVVGAGVAGCCCATLCARAGLSVLLLERAARPGSKNLSGGRLYGYAFEAIFPGFARSAPLERKITREKLSTLNSGGASTLEYQHADAHSWSVLRARLDPWLFAQAEQAGAQCLTGIQIEALHSENGSVRGVIVEGDVLFARAVVIAEGANTLLAEQHRLVEKLPKEGVAVGVKEVLALPRETLENRFALEANEGAAWLFTGGICADLPAGGFLYTNDETLSLGLVFPLSSLRGAPAPLPELLEQFKQHPALRPLLRGAEVMEYGAHLVPECGLKGMPERLAGKGYLLVGDSARFCVNTGFTIRGMDLAALSAQAAAQTLIIALGQDSDADMQPLYQRQLEANSLWSIMSRYQKMPGFLRTPALYQAYPGLLAELQQDIYTVDSAPPQRVATLLWRHALRTGWPRLLKDIFRGGRSL
jgi:electron transfer flavoprotein-quinone oxidoreductase